MKRAGKSVLGALAYSLGLHRRILGNRAVIIAFHRVTDSPQGTSLNCPPAVFDELCRFFKKYFSVIPLSELLERVRQNEPIGDMLSITFDDGYRDNYLVAAPILKRLELPATFFVATNFIGSNRVPPWDAEDGFESEWMSWEEVRELHSMGFDIGGHTMNHANLGSIDPETASTEIEGCREILTGKLGVNVPHFAYPFGGVDNINPAATERVAAAGFTCCLSCHGGIVSAGDDVFELPREPINSWVTSAYQYGLELLMKAREARA